MFERSRESSYLSGLIGVGFLVLFWFERESVQWGSFFLLNLNDAISSSEGLCLSFKFFTKCWRALEVERKVERANQQLLSLIRQLSESIEFSSFHNERVDVIGMEDLVVEFLKNKGLELSRRYFAI